MSSTRRWRPYVSLARAAHLGAVAVAVTVAGNAIALLGASVPAATAAVPQFVGSIGACGGAAGAVVVVDFRTWSGPIALGCDTSGPGHGIDLLHDTGFATQGDQHDGPAFICRIGSSRFDGGTRYPTPAHVGCLTTPPASSYWSYWLARAGQDSWRYSPKGACTDVPVPGQIEAWVYGTTDLTGPGGQPDFTPDEVRARESVTGSGDTGKPHRPSMGCVNSGPPGGHPGQGGGPPSSGADVPKTITGPASHREATTATISGRVTPGSADVSYYFEYGTTGARGRRTAEVPLAAGQRRVTVGARLSGLRPHTRYHYRLLASGSAGSSHGTSRDLTTLYAPRRLTLDVARAKHDHAAIRFSVAGALTLPPGLKRSRGCRGTVTIRALRGPATLVALPARVHPTCTYARTVNLPAVRLSGRGTLWFRAVFDGNAAVAPRAARKVGVKTGRLSTTRARAAALRTPNRASAVRYLVSSTHADGLAHGTSLAAAGYYESGPRSADFGLTIDGAFALAATRSDKAVLRKVVTFIRSAKHDRGGRTVNNWTGIGTKYPIGGAIGKEALLAEVTGYNPRRFGSRDLITALAGAICDRSSRASGCAAPGNYRYSSSTFDQALAIIAQIRAGQSQPAAPAVRYLERLQHRNGAWPSLIPSTGDSDVDSTAMAVMALSLLHRSATAAAAAGRAIKWIASRQKRTGGFPGAAGQSTNSAALAIQALRLGGSRYAKPIDRALGFIAGEQNADGGFKVAAGGGRQSDVRASTQAVNGIVGTSFGTLRDDIAR